MKVFSQFLMGVFFLILVYYFFRNPGETSKIITSLGSVFDTGVTTLQGR